MCSHQISQLSHFRIKYELGISFKRNLRKAWQKKTDAEDETLMMGYLLMKRKMRKRRNHQRKQWVREIFLQRESHGACY